MGEEELRASRASRSQLATISVQDLDDGGWIWGHHGRRSTCSLDLSLLLSFCEVIGWERVVAKAVGERVEAMAGGEGDVGWRRRSGTGKRDGDGTGR